MTSLHLFLLILLMHVAHFLDIFTSIITHGTFKDVIYSCAGKAEFSGVQCLVVL